jgi:deazaflavin-dependent oxidoreductase (nitroreductase family)
MTRSTHGLDIADTQRWHTGWPMPPEDDQSIGEQLAEWGKVALIETRGRHSSRPTTAAVGFVEESDGSLLVAAGSGQADWALNLRATADCRVTVGDRTADYTAVEIHGPDHARALTGLILKYGTPAERLGHGPVFRLTPTTIMPT